MEYQKIHESCVALRGQPGLTEDDIKAVITSIDHPVRKLEKIERLVTEDDVQWVLLFQNREMAEDCIRKGYFVCYVDKTKYVVRPTSCPANIIPGSWFNQAEGACDQSQGQSLQDWYFVPRTRETDEEEFYSIIEHQDDQPWSSQTSVYPRFTNHEQRSQAPTSQASKTSYQGSANLASTREISEEMSIPSDELFGSGSKILKDTEGLPVTTDSVKSDKLFGFGHSTYLPKSSSLTNIESTKQDSNTVDSATLFGSGGHEPTTEKLFQSDPGQKKSLNVIDKIEYAFPKNQSFSSSQLFGSGKQTDFQPMSTEFEPQLDKEEINNEPEKKEKLIHCLDSSGEKKENANETEELWKNDQGEKDKTASDSFTGTNMHTFQAKGSLIADSSPTQPYDVRPPFYTHSPYMPTANPVHFPHIQHAYQMYRPYRPTFMAPNNMLYDIPSPAPLSAYYAPFPLAHLPQYEAVPKNNPGPQYQQHQLRPYFPLSPDIHNYGPYRYPYQQQFTSMPVPQHNHRHMGDGTPSEQLPDVDEAALKFYRNVQHPERIPKPQSRNNEDCSNYTQLQMDREDYHYEDYEDLDTAEVSLSTPKTTDHNIQRQLSKDKIKLHRSASEDRAEMSSLSSNLEIISLDEKEMDRSVEQTKHENTKLKVTGLTDNILKDTLELFFESRHMSNQGYVVETTIDYKKGQAILEFKERKSMLRVLERQKNGPITYENMELKVFEYISPPLDPHKVCVSGMSERTSHEGLTLYIEVMVTLTPVKILYGDAHGRALIIFDDVVDVHKIQEDFNRRKLDDCTLLAEAVEVSSSVRVRGSCMGQSLETLELYCESKRSQGGKVETVEPHTDGNSFIVTFANVKDAENMCRKTDHVLNGKQLTVTLYYPCLDCDSYSSKREPVKIPGPLQLDLDSYMLRFLKRYKKYGDLVEKNFSLLHGRVEWPGTDAGQLTIVCTASEPDDSVDVDDDLREILTNWPEKCHQALTQVTQHLEVGETITVAKEVWPATIEHLSSINISSPNDIGVFANKDNASIVVVGYNQLVDTLVSSIKEELAKLESDLMAQRHSATKTKNFLSYQWALVHALKVPDLLRKSGVKFTFNNDSRSLTLEGSLQIVDETLAKIEKQIRSCPRKPVEEFRKNSINLIFQTPTRNLLKKELDKKHVIGVWDNCRGTLYMYSKTEEDAQTAVSVLKSVVHQGNIRLSSTTSRQLASTDGQKLLQRLRSTHDGLLLFSITPTDLDYTCVSSISRSVQEEIDEFFNLHSLVKETLPVDECLMKYINNFKKRELENIEQQYARLNVSIEYVNTEGCREFRVRGTRDGCKMTIKKLQDLLSEIHRAHHRLTVPGIQSMLMTRDGLSELRQIEIKHDCVLQLQKNQKTQMFKCARVTVLTTEVMVIRANLLELAVDAIVNPSNRDLINSTGLGEKLIKAGGPSVQEDCRKKLAAKGSSLGAGEVVITRAGRLPFQHIFHAVIGRWKGGSSNEQMHLKRCVADCLTKAAELDLKTLAFPIIGLGNFQYSAKNATCWLLGELTSFLTDRNHSHSLEKVYIVDLEQAAYGIMVEELKKMFPNTKETKASIPVGDIKSVEEFSEDSEEESLFEGSEATPVDGLQLGNIEVSIVVGELIKQKVDVIVNSTNQNMDLKIGHLSKTILTAAGPKIQVECSDTYPNGLKIGEVAETSGGQLPCHRVFHGTFTPWNNGAANADQTMAKFVACCLELADQRGSRSIGFPALGTGVLGYPADTVARLMFECVQAHSVRNPRSKLRKVLFVVWSGDAATVKAFQSEEKRQKRKAKTIMPSASGSTQEATGTSADLYAQVPGYNTSVGSLMVQFLQGDITKQRTHGIVNCVQKNLNLSYGNVSKAILIAAGDRIQQECSTRENQLRMLKDKLVVSSGGKLSCQKILHMKARSKSSGWKTSIIKCLEEAHTLGLQSLAFPAIGTGAQGQKPETMARILMDAFEEFGKSSKLTGVLRTVKVVIFQTDMLQRFVASLKGDPPSSFNKFPVSVKRKKAVKSEDDIIVHIYAGSEYKAGNAKEALDKLFEERKSEVPFTLWNEVTDMQKSKLKEMATSKGVNISFDKKKSNLVIHLSGFSQTVNRTMNTITAYLRNIEKDLKKQEPKSDAVSLPISWAKMSLTSPPVDITLITTDTEYKTVADTFNKQLPQVKIVRIQRIQNPNLYVRFVGKRHQMELSNKHTNNERWLWHGTKPAVVPSINEKGFNRNYNSGASHGAGVYFAVNATTSTGYCQANAQGEKFMYFAQVLTGDFCLGRSGIRYPPLRPGTTSEYDSTTDKVNAPHFFVVFHDDQAYPTYLITFK